MVDSNPDAIQRNVRHVSELLILFTTPVPTDHDEVAIQQTLL